MNSSDYQLLYRKMLAIRRVEEALRLLFSEGQIPGFLHLSIGQEAVSVGVSSCLRDSDIVSSNHRGHGHTLAKGVDLTGFFAEILGKATGLCGGRGGSMHVADLSKGMLGANGIVGAGLPITTGSALALKIQDRGDVAVVYFGDGALAEGLVHECFNIAALWNLPVLFVCENNGWSEFSPSSGQIATTPKKLAKAFGIRFAGVDGNRIEQVAAAAERLITSMRKDRKPAILECCTTRVRGHFEGDKQDYRESGEIASLEAHDPLRLAREEMERLGVETDWFDRIEEKTGKEIHAATQAALAAPQPSPADVTAYVYTDVSG